METNPIDSYRALALELVISPLSFVLIVDLPNFRINNDEWGIK